MLDDLKIGIIGLGYVGLPLAIELGSKFTTIGYDIDATRINEIKSGKDRTAELDESDFQKACYIKFTKELCDIADCNFYIVTVPTPVDINNMPDLSSLIMATKTVSSVLSHGDIVVYESTVFPGATEEICVPILENESGLVFNQDFSCGYSPERINPGDKIHRLPDIAKITSGSNEGALNIIDKVYKAIITVGTIKVSSIKIAEAAKIIENTQRDVNIALINELSMIFARLNLDTYEVLEAAGSKWNFLKFQPGLVGGHCIGVDPYYLAYKARQLDYEPNLILSGRRINNYMPVHIAHTMIKKMFKKCKRDTKKHVLVLGLTFKENCPDTRNSKVLDLVKELESFGIIVECFDPHVVPEAISLEYDMAVITEPEFGKYDGIIVAVAHNEFRILGSDKIRLYGKPDHLLFDLKNIFPISQSDIRL
ncbi:nucleotide sugar dehydrogenase [Amylibacter sp.]|nr:nucleotide sugar dehydrogenase [Amylibacter sp.]